MVYFVGAGCGAPDLITVRGMRLLGQADVIIYAGSLVNPELLSYKKEACRVYNSATMTLDEVISEMERAEREGAMTVRLHTGDPSVYGAVREQMDRLDARGILYESCPGVSACFGTAAAMNLEYTLPEVAQSLIVTRMEGRTSVPPLESIELFAQHQTSMAIYLSAGRLEELSGRLIAGGYPPDTPAAIAYRVSWPDERIIRCRVDELAEKAGEHGITKTALILVGRAIAHESYAESRLYAPDFETEFRRAGGAQLNRVDPIERDTASDRGGQAGRNADFICAEQVRREGSSDSSLSGESRRPLPAEWRKIYLAAFTQQGRQLAERVRTAFPEAEFVMYDTSLPPMRQNASQESTPPSRHEKDAAGTEDESTDTDSVTGKKRTLTEWAADAWSAHVPLLIIGAAGIAVRAIAPMVRDKLSDVPVVVMDECGRHCIPLLSGHAGGANALAKAFAEAVGAECVLTTATDLHGLFAVDVFAAENRLAIRNREAIAKVSSRLLRGEQITMAVEAAARRVQGKPPAGVCVVSYGERAQQQKKDRDVIIVSDTSRISPEPGADTLILTARPYVLGMGCRRGKSADELEEFAREVCRRAGIDPRQLGILATIDRKADEEGLRTLARRLGLAFRVYPAERLSSVEGEFSGSNFVREQVGVENVCERAAVAAAAEQTDTAVPKAESERQGGRTDTAVSMAEPETQGGQTAATRQVQQKDAVLLLRKQARDGMTAAIARGDWGLKFR